MGSWVLPISAPVDALPSSGCGASGDILPLLSGCESPFAHAAQQGVWPCRACLLLQERMLAHLFRGLLGSAEISALRPSASALSLDIH